MEPSGDAEQRIVELLTTGGDANWHVGVAAALSVAPEERSSALIVGMIEAWRRDVEWSTSRYAADLGTASRGETPSYLAHQLALTGDPAILPPLAWRAAGLSAAVVYEFGLQAVPHTCPPGTPGGRNPVRRFREMVKLAVEG